MNPNGELPMRVTQDIVRVIALTSLYGDRTILDDVDLAIRQGEICVVMGPSGCGKTTLLRHMCGLKAPSMGAVYVAGKDLYAADSEHQRQMRLATGLSFQGGALLGSLTVLDNVALPLRENTAMAESVIREIALMKLDMVGLAHAAGLLPSSLSGGMRKRAAIARAIALDPQVVYFDEPSAGLDPVTAAEVDNLITKLNKVFGITMVVVTHDLSSAYTIADRVVMLLDGKVAAIGCKDEVWHSTEPRIRDFIERRLSRGDEVRSDIANLIVI